MTNDLISGLRRGAQRMLWLIVGVMGVGAAAVSLSAVLALPRDVESSDYAPVVRTQALIADVLPPPAYALEAYACALELVVTQNGATKEVLCNKVDSLHKELRASHVRWQRDLPSGPVRDAFVGPAHDTAEALFATLEHDLLPAVARGASEAEQREILESRVRPLYLEHRQAIDVVVARANGETAATLEAAARAIEERRASVIGLALALLGATAFIAWRLRRFLSLGLDAQVKAQREIEEAMTRAQVSERALAKARDELEARVLERTRELRAILDNVVFGFLTIGPDLRVREGYTHSCEALFGTTDILGRRLAEVLGLDDVNAGDLALNVDQVFDDFLPEEVSLSQLPHRFRLGNRVLRLEARAVRDDAGKVALLLLTVSDSTRLEQVEQENEANRSLLSILRQRPAFDGFLEETKKQLHLASTRSHEEPVVRRVTHTIKGNAAVYGIAPVVRVAHQVEEQPQILPEHIDRLAGAFREWLEQNADVLGVHFDGPAEAHVEVSAGHLDQLRSLARTLPPATQAKLNGWLDAVSRVPARQLLGPINQTAQHLAERLGKKVDVVVDGGDVLVDSERLRPLFAVVPHLVRNALDHGIEYPDERGTKPEVATLRIQFSASNPGKLSLVVADDGRGIDADAVARAAVKKGVLDEAAAARLGAKEKLALIFLDSVSTKDEVTDVSGRGVGMSAVKAEVEALGGEIELASTPGQGARFEIRLAA